jgi:tetratricopeptide (TPR) repeat protein
MGKRSRTRSLRTEPVAAPVPPPSSYSSHPFLIAAGLVAVVFAVFGQLVTHEFVNFDDPVYVTRNPHVLAGLTLDGIRWAFTSLDFNWHPVTWLTHMLDVQLFGVRPGMHLLVNVVIHAANAVLLFVLLRRMTERTWRSAVVAALFAIHPLHVESVAWLAERKDVLSTLFLLLTLLFYLDFVRGRSRWRYALMLLMFILGLMSKGMLVTLPFVLLLVDYWPLERWAFAEPRRLGALFIEKIPLFLIDIPAVLITLKGQQAASALAAPTSVSLPIRIANALISYVTYLGKTIWPVRLAIPYPYRMVISPTASILAAIVLLAITAAVLWQARRRRYLFAGWFWFAGMLVPVIGLVQIGKQSMADRYTYAPLIGVFLAIVWLVSDWICDRPALRRPVHVLTALVVAVLGVAAAVQASYWHDSIRLFTHTVEVTGRNTIAHDSLGAAWFVARDYDRAAADYNAALEADPRDVLARYGLGLVQQAQGQPVAAAESFRAALAIDPGSADMLRALGEVELANGNTAAAADALRKAAAKDPSDLRARALLLLSQNDLPGAIATYEEAARQHPEDAEVQNNLAAALAKAGRNAEALEHYLAALRLDPSLYDAHMNVAALFSRENRNGEALSHFRDAAQLRPASPEPLVYLALLHGNQGETALAIDEITRAIRIDERSANSMITNAIHLPPKETNAREYLGYLQGRGK